MDKPKVEEGRGQSKQWHLHKEVLSVVNFLKVSLQALLGILHSMAW